MKTFGNLPNTSYNLACFRTSRFRVIPKRLDFKFNTFVRTKMFPEVCLWKENTGKHEITFEIKPIG